MASPMGFDEAETRAGATRRQPARSEQFHFLPSAKNQTEQKKILTEQIKNLHKSEVVFVKGLRNAEDKKMASPMGFEPMLPG